MTANQQPNKEKNQDTQNICDDDVIEDINPNIPSQEIIKETAAKRIAYIVVIGFFILLAIPLVYLFDVMLLTQANQTTIDLAFNQATDLMKTIAASLGGIVGAVVTYYFTIAKKD